MKASVRRTHTQWKQPAAVIENWRLVCAQRTKGSFYFSLTFRSLPVSPAVAAFLLFHSLSLFLSFTLLTSALSSPFYLYPTHLIIYHYNHRLYQDNIQSDTTLNTLPFNSQT